MADVGVTVVGAGVVGLAVAARLARDHPDLVLLERRDKPGQEQSSRNSEVIHAGMYYPPGSLKARLCVDGKRRRCQRKGIPHARITRSSPPSPTTSCPRWMPSWPAAATTVSRWSGWEPSRPG